MKSPPFAMARALRSAGGNAVTSGEIGVAAVRVIAKRVALGMSATIDPASADHAEFARMIPEKTAAFSQAGAGWLRASARIGAQMSGLVAAETITLAGAMAAIAACKTPAGIVDIQSRFATAWFARAAANAATLGRLVTESQRAALRPIHRTVTGNVRRLKA